MIDMNPEVDIFFSKAEKWQEELKKLRNIILDCQLKEGLKWNVPVYSFNKKNIVGINELKEYCSIAFFKGVLLKDELSILHKPGEFTQSGRWIRFKSVQEIVELEYVIKAYIQEAIEVEKAGLKVELKKTTEYSIPDEFQTKLDEIPVLKTAFKALTPGRQRAYLFYFSQPKQSKTRETRIEKNIPQILAGKGLGD